MKFRLIEAKSSDAQRLQNMGRFYVYDIAEYTGWNVPDDGLYECDDLTHYLNDEKNWTYLIESDGALAGFAIVQQRDGLYDMAQFFILRKFKANGLGREVACELFSRFGGPWMVRVLIDNTGAILFWRKVVQSFTKANFREERRTIDGERIVFYFNS